MPARLTAQRAATADDFPGLTFCQADSATTRLSVAATDTLLRAQLEAHEAVHRAQAAASGSCATIFASLNTARKILDAEFPAYCAQWRVAVAQGAEPRETRRDFAWRMAAQSGAMENRLQMEQRMQNECAQSPVTPPEPAAH